MPLPDEFWADQAATLAGVRAARSKTVSFVLFPPRKASEPAWLMVGKLGTVNRRARQARAVGRAAFLVGNAIRGQVEATGGRLLLIVDDGSDALLRASRRKWATALANAKPQDAELADAAKAAGRIAALLKRAQVYTAEEARSRPWEGQADDGGDDTPPLTTAELEDIFGPDEAAEIGSVAARSAAKLARLSAPAPPPTIDRDALAAVRAPLGAALAAGGLDGALGVLGDPANAALVGSVQAVLQLGVIPGDPEQARFVDLAEAMMVLDGATRLWARAVERLEDVKAALVELNATIEATADAEEAAALEDELALLLDRHGRFEQASLSAEEAHGAQARTTAARMKAAVGAEED